jgi:hypothetical protein
MEFFMSDKVLKSIGAAFVTIFLYALAGLAVGLLIMLLWNWIMPEIFGLMKIGYIQGWGMYFLFGLLFNGTQKVELKKKN